MAVVLTYIGTDTEVYNVQCKRIDFISASEIIAEDHDGFLEKIDEIFSIVAIEETV